MLNTDEYMKTIIGDTYTRSEINIKEPTLQTVDFYPTDEYNDWSE